MRTDANPEVKFAFAVLLGLLLSFHLLMHDLILLALSFTLLRGLPSRWPLILFYVAPFVYCFYPHSQAWLALLLVSSWFTDCVRHELRCTLSDSAQETLMTRTAKLLLIAPMLLLQVLFFDLGGSSIDLSMEMKAHYLLASRLVLMHRWRYLDLFYNQAPLLPYIYALWMKYTAVSWNSARIFSVLLTTLLGVLLYEHVCRQTRSWIAGLLAVVLFASSTLVFAWFPVVKTHSLAGLFLFCAYVGCQPGPLDSVFSDG